MGQRKWDSKPGAMSALKSGDQETDRCFLGGVAEGDLTTLHVFKGLCSFL